jgi:hypothetical protein
MFASLTTRINWRFIVVVIATLLKTAKSGGRKQLFGTDTYSPCKIGVNCQSSYRAIRRFNL